jgi:putative oxidoreductase
MENQKNSRGLNIGLWIAQIILGAMFTMAGIMKATQPAEALMEVIPWANATPIALVRFIGVSELLGGLGLLLPSLLRLKPRLSVWAAIGLMTVMLLAALFHVIRAEYSDIGMNVLLMSIAAFIAWGRSKKVPISAR